VSTESTLFPLYQLMDAFEAFSNGEPNVKPQHRSLYYFLLGYARKRGNVPRFTLPFEVGMHGSSIGSWTTYDAAIKALAEWGFIVYAPGANRYKVPVVELTFRNPSGDELLTYWQAYCLAYPVELQKGNPSPVVELQNQNPSPVVGLQICSSTDNSSANSTGDIKKTIRHKTNDGAASTAECALSSEKKPASKRAKKVGADFTQIAALPLPHAGPEFAEAWQTFYTQNTKQAGKPLTAFELMLKKLGKRPVGFAIVMLEAAIQGDWSGVENPGTARAFDTWQAEQRSRPPVAQPTVPTATQEEELDEPARLFRAEQAAKAAAARAAHFAHWAAK
jgi:hypothetical protein